MRLLVLGGSGFMGSNFIEHIIYSDKNIKILVYDKLNYSSRLENLANVKNNKRLSFIKGDINNVELFEKFIKKTEPDIVINFAAETHVDKSINEPDAFITTNILGVYRILELLRRWESTIFYIHISTDEVYGDLRDINRKADESWPINPSNPYSASKAAGDLLVSAYGKTYGLRYRIVRPCNNYGPRQHPEKLIPRTIVRLLLGRPATIYGDGLQVRDWLYVNDFVKALDTIIRKGLDYEVYNVCAGEFATVKNIVEAIVGLMGKDPRKDIIYVRGRPGEDRRYAMKCEKVRELGWNPRVSLEDGLRRTVEWYIVNRWWWEPLLDERYVLSDEPWY